MLGGKMDVKTLYGNQTVTIKNGTQHGDKVKLSKMVSNLMEYLLITKIKIRVSQN